MSALTPRLLLPLAVALVAGCTTANPLPDAKAVSDPTTAATTTTAGTLPTRTDAAAAGTATPLPVACVLTAMAGQTTVIDHARCLAFHYSVESPRDVATGQASGKRQHKPITLFMEWDASTPLLKALVDQDRFTSVELDFTVDRQPPTVAAAGAASPPPVETVLLDGASVEGVQQVLGDPTSLCAPDERCPVTTTDPRDVAQVSLVAQRATFKDSGGKTMAVDDWTK